MTRPISQTVLDALTTDIMVQLDRWSRGASRSDVDRLAACLSVAEPMVPIERRHFNKAARELREAVSVEPDRQPEIIKGWVKRYLLAGRDMLVSEAESNRMLARARDRLARQQKAAGGKHSARIEMAASSWDRLHEIQLEKKFSSRAQALELIIKAYKLKAKSKVGTVTGQSDKQVALGGSDDGQGTFF